MNHVRHEHNRTPEMNELGIEGYFHTHAYGDVPHSHMMRAICFRPECHGCPTHDIHPGPVRTFKFTGTDAKEAGWNDQSLAYRNKLKREMINMIVTGGLTANEVIMAGYGALRIVAQKQEVEYELAMLIAETP